MMRKLSIALIVIILVLIAVVGSFVWDGFLISPGPDADEVVFDIEQGLSLKQISRQLKDDELIKSRFMFEIFVRMTGADTSIKAGEFTLSTGMSYASLVSAFTAEVVNENSMTFPEGYTLSQIGERTIITLDNVTLQDWKSATGSESPFFDSYNHLLGSAPDGHDLEGYLFPDTYRFRSDATAQTVVETMLLTLERRLAENDIVVPEDFIMKNGMTFHEVMTLASIIEREVRGEEDMRKVADIFLTRLEIGMALQADSTVNYFTGGDSPSISLEDRDIESPYNTYKNVGLTPGPISHPGITSIKAVLDPIENEALYFLTTPEGEVIYSVTFDQHVANKNKFLR